MIFSLYFAYEKHSIQFSALYLDVVIFFFHVFFLYLGPAYNGKFNFLQCIVLNKKGLLFVIVCEFTYYSIFKCNGSSDVLYLDVVFFFHVFFLCLGPAYNGKYKSVQCIEINKVYCLLLFVNTHIIK